MCALGRHEGPVVVRNGKWACKACNNDLQELIANLPDGGVSRQININIRNVIASNTAAVKATQAAIQSLKRFQQKRPPTI